MLFKEHRVVREDSTPAAGKSIVAASPVLG